MYLQPVNQVFLPYINKSKCKLIVPKNSSDAYKQAYQWEDFPLVVVPLVLQIPFIIKQDSADVQHNRWNKRLAKQRPTKLMLSPKGSVYIVNGKKDNH